MGLVCVYNLVRALPSPPQPGLARSTVAGLAYDRLSELVGVPGRLGVIGVTIHVTR